MSMRKAYVVFLTPVGDEKDTYLIEVPDLDILTEGYGIADAIYMARDAIGSVIIARQDTGVSIPEPTAMDDIDISWYYNDKAIKTLVDIDLNEYRKKVDNKSVRRNITLPSWLNNAAKEASIDVSKVTQEALKEKLNLN